MKLCCISAPKTDARLSRKNSNLSNKFMTRSLREVASYFYSPTDRILCKYNCFTCNVLFFPVIFTEPDFEMAKTEQCSD